MPLTDTAIKNTKPKDKPQKLFDGGGLFLQIAPNGGKWWRLKYRFAAKEKLISLGTYPTVSLRAARQRRDEAKDLLAQGIDPGEQKKAAKIASIIETQNSFEAIAREWHALYSPKWVETHQGNIISGLQKDFFPLIGHLPIHEITAPILLAVLRRIEGRGAPKTAKKFRQTCGQIFRYAIATGRGQHDPATALKDALTPPTVKNFASIKDPKEIGILLRDIDAYEGNIIVQSALRLAPLVFVRPGELRRAEWQEINFETAEWRIPAEKMKMREGHIVPLATQALSILHVLKEYTGKCLFLFPSMRANSAPISDMTLLAALRRMGYTKEQMTVHGFRSMASTLLNEQGYNRDWIERQLAHGERNSIRATYNYAQYLPERRKMMQEWADYLTSLKG